MARFYSRYQVALPQLIMGILFGIVNSALADGQADRPNVVLIMTDDQGHGDLGFHGNSKIRTPQLDDLAKQSVRFDYFYVSPVCSATRASLMTGRYNYRTGVVDTYMGRSMMHTEEVTIAEMLGEAGYRTGIFGKWHLGDNHPMRPMDQGFDESLVHRGGGITQAAGPPGDSYFDAVLEHNGQTVRSNGYCSDVFTDSAIRFIEQHRDRPFFVYLSFNCPHTPLQVPDQYVAPYKRMNLAHEVFPAVGYPLIGEAEQDELACVYGMVTNIDDNLGRLLAQLDALELADNTIVIFLTDNGPQQERYKSGLRGLKGQTYDGGIRVPCFVRWPAKFQAGRREERIAAHIDIAPTLLDACGVKKPASVLFDGVNLMPVLAGIAGQWPARTLFFQAHRGPEPEPFRAAAVREARYKLVLSPTAFGRRLKTPVVELFDMHADPYEQHDLTVERPNIVARLKASYLAWLRDVGATRGYAPPRIHLGTPHENPVILTRQDWRGHGPGWGINGHWEVHVVNEGSFDLRLRFKEVGDPRSVHISLSGVTREASIAAGAAQHTFDAVTLPTGPGRLHAWIAHEDQNRGVEYVDVIRLGS